MAAAPIALFDNGHHKCLMFDSLVTGEGVQSNQFLIVDGKHEALIDPGGDLTYTPLSVAATGSDVDYLLEAANHYFPDHPLELLHLRAERPILLPERFVSGRPRVLGLGGLVIDGRPDVLQPPQQRL